MSLSQEISFGKRQNPVVCVVIATYNGATYLPELLASLAAQRHRPDQIVLRDDDSSDQSVELVQKWTALNAISLQLVKGGRLGPCQSFMCALKAANSADIYFFCDQDDVWLPCKISRAVSSVPWGATAQATLYASRLQVVDALLKPTRLSAIPHNLSFASACCENVLTGCTMAFNERFKQEITSYLPVSAVMHDWWFYLFASAARNTELIYDEEPTLLYRQHGANVLGAGPIGWTAWWARVCRFFANRRQERSVQLAEFNSYHGDLLQIEASALLNQLLSAKQSIVARLTASLTSPIKRQTIISNVTTRISILVNRF